MYERKCPICNVMLLYKNQRSYKYAVSKHSICIKCARKKRKTLDITTRKCPSCGITIEYSTKYSASYYEKKQSKCKSCAAKTKNKTHLTTPEYKHKMSNQFSGSNNPMYSKSIYSIWVSKYGIDIANQKQKELNNKRSILFAGKNNPMYGKPAPLKSGNGWSGWYHDSYFRSLRELSFMFRMDEYGIKWISGEKLEYTCFNDNISYRPDFIVGGTMIEIKPIRLWNTQNVLSKQKLAIAFCNKYNMRYKIIDPTLLTIDQIMFLLNNNVIKFTKATFDKWQVYYDQKNFTQ